MLTIIFFCFGLIIGSFLNVVILRFNTKKSLGGRSACMSCQNTLSWYELIPVFSFVGLRGRCRTCKTKISAQYLAVELSSGIIFALIFVKFSYLLFSAPAMFAITFAYYALMFAILVVIAAYDVKHKIIPDMLSLLFGVLAFAGMFLFSRTLGVSGFSGLSLHLPTLLDFFAGIFMAFPFAFFWFISHGAWMGFGDAKLALGLGWFLGLPLALSALMIAFWSGAIIGLGLIMFSSNKYGMKSEIPFAVYLVFGAVLVLLCNVQVLPIGF